jgi:hypothetical protein
MADAAERIASVALRMAVGICAFSLAALTIAFLVRRILPDPLGVAWLIGGGMLGAVATVVTRGAGRRPLGHVLTALGYVSLCGIVAIPLLPSGDCDLNTLSTAAMTLMLVPLWLFLSARAGRSR